MRFHWLLVLLFLTSSGILLATPAQKLTVAPPRAIEGIVFAGQIKFLRESAFNSILNAPDVDYVLFQVIRPAGSSESLETEMAPIRERIAALKNAGKKPVLQIWWGGGLDVYPWEIWSFPSIVFDERVRAAFFQQVTDPIIDALRPENLYGVHLMEELGIQFGSDAPNPGACGPDIIPNPCLIDRHASGCPGAFSDGTGDGNSYHSPSYSANFAPPDYLYDGRNMCNLRRYRHHFEQEVNVPFESAEAWLLDLWTGNRIISGIDVVFAEHVKGRYPELKVYSWQFPDLNNRTVVGDSLLIGRHDSLDGWIINPYMDLDIAYRTGRFARLLAPGKEILYLAGMQDPAVNFVHTDVDRRKLATMAYLIGADAFGYFNLPWLQNREGGDASFTNDLLILKKLGSIPVLRNQPRILLISNLSLDVYSDYFQFTSFKRFDYLTPLQASAVDLQRYDLVVLYEAQGGGSPEFGVSEGSLRHWSSEHMVAAYGIGMEFDDAVLDHYINKGGLVAVIGGWDLGTRRPSFSRDYISFDTFYYDTSREGPPHLPETFAIDKWFVENFQIPHGTTYRTTVRQKIVYLNPEPPTTVHQIVFGDPGLGGIYYQKGLGGVLILPNNIENAGQPWDSNLFAGRRRYLSDLFCGLAFHHGRQALREEMVCSSSLVGGQQGYLSDQGEVIEAAIVNPRVPPPPIRCRGRGTDLWTGERSPLLTTSRGSFLCRQAQDTKGINKSIPKSRTTPSLMPR